MVADDESMININESMIEINESMIMSVCIMYVCRMYILDVFDDCVAVVGCSISVCLMSKFEMSVCSLCVSRIFANECLLDNCFKDVRVLNA